MCRFHYNMSCSRNALCDILCCGENSSAHNLPVFSPSFASERHIRAEMIPPQNAFENVAVRGYEKSNIFFCSALFERVGRWNLFIFIHGQYRRKKLLQKKFGIWSRRQWRWGKSLTPCMAHSTFGLQARYSPWWFETRLQSIKGFCSFFYVEIVECWVNTELFL